MPNAILGEVIYKDDYVTIYKNGHNVNIVKNVGGKSVYITNILHGEDSFFVQFDGDVVVKHAPEGVIFSG